MADAEAKRREERVKLVASALSTLGVAIIVTGVIAPVLAGHVRPVATGLAFVLGLGLHVTAQVVLHLVVVEPTLETSDEPR